MTMRVALLRGVNVGGNKKVAMADLKAMVENSVTVYELQSRYRRRRDGGNS